MVPRADMPPAVRFLLAIVASALLPSKLDMKESVASYDSRRMSMQFVFDQGAISIAEDACFSSIRESESSFINVGRNKILSNFALFY